MTAVMNEPSTSAQVDEDAKTSASSDEAAALHLLGTCTQKAVMIRNERMVTTNTSRAYNECCFRALSRALFITINGVRICLSSTSCFPKHDLSHAFHPSLSVFH
eukprot:TRINITY_DN8885_c0_g1_i1.p4 TRINITY_DN8885_c0_g1~~TRINITY_DN8885_c0_g1_i1.p4  ORF type:complete len:104 (+),score=12.21 TRINITY_DN8885_c0_g1_i1:303-614(+)